MLSISSLLSAHSEALNGSPMAVGFLSRESQPPVYNGSITVYIILSCLVAASGGILFGFDLGISGGVSSMDSFLKKFFPSVYAKMKSNTKSSNYCKFDSQLLTAFTSSLYIAGLFASLCASPVTRTFGRRVSMLIGGVVFLAGAAMGGAAQNIYMLILGRVLFGAGIGFTNQAVPLYLSEIAPPQYRGAFNNTFEVCVSLGILTANLINYGNQRIQWGWRLSLALGVIPALFLTIGTLFLPETPNYVIQQSGNTEKARKLLQVIRGTDDVQTELDDLIAASEIAKTIQHPFRNIIRRKYRPHLVMAIAMSFFQQVTGINVINFYAPIMFRTIGFKESASLMSAVVTRVTAGTFNCITLAIVDKVGRRMLFLIGGVQMLISLIAVGGILGAELGDHNTMSKEYGYTVLVIVCVYVAGFSWSWGPLAWLIASEIFPLEIRSAGQSIFVSVNFFSTFLVAQTFLAMLCHFRFTIFFFFAGWAFVITLFVYMFLPETKGVPLEQMDRIWREHWYWKKIVKDGDEKKMDASS